MDSEDIDSFISTLRLSGTVRGTLACYAPGSVLMPDDTLHERGHYDDLPPIGLPRHIFPLTGYDLSIGVTTYDLLSSAFTAKDIRALDYALSFVRSGSYINLSRVELTATYVSQDIFLKVSGYSTHAICLMPGVVSRSNISIKQPADTDLVRTITLQPIVQEFCREVTYWSQKYGYSDAMTTVTPEGIVFSTKGHELEADERNTTAFSCALDHAVEIPVYDGRPKVKPFKCTERCFSALESWPRYRGDGQCGEIPANSLAIVGYKPVRALSRRGGVFIPHLQFVILLGFAVFQ